MHYWFKRIKSLNTCRRAAIVPQECQSIGARSGTDSRFLLSSSRAFSRVSGLDSSFIHWYIFSLSTCASAVVTAYKLQRKDKVWRKGEDEYAAAAITETENHFLFMAGKVTFMKTHWLSTWKESHPITLANFAQQNRNLITQWFLSTSCWCQPVSIIYKFSIIVLQIRRTYHDHKQTRYINCFAIRNVSYAECFGSANSTLPGYVSNC